MCGIVGFLDKTGKRAEPLGKTVVAMLRALSCRGPDSAGVALFRAAPEAGLVLRIKLGDDETPEPIAAKVIERVRSVHTVAVAERAHSYLRLVVGGSLDTIELERLVESAAIDVEVVSMGRQLEIVKQVGSPERLDADYGISQFQGSHGLGHTRLSTESRVDLSHSQPFWAHGRPDLAVVHNGHITNYHQLRRRYEQRGTRLYTENDSEIIGVYLAGQLAKGLTLEEALKASVADLDGSFSYFAATGDQLGFARDPFALKPLLFAETEEFVALATEEIAIRSALPGHFAVRESQAKEVRVWRR